MMEYDMWSNNVINLTEKKAGLNKCYVLLILIEVYKTEFMFI